MIMFIGAVTARLPVAVVLGLAIPMVSAVVARLREDTSALPSTRSRDWRVSELSESLAAWTEAYAAYLNTPARQSRSRRAANDMASPSGCHKMAMTQIEREIERLAHGAPLVAM
jgi:hypothetical protein